MIVIIDNYDSFTYNLYQYVSELYDDEVKVFRNDRITVDELERETKRITFFGWEENGELVGVMGIEPVKDVTLIRHAYVLPLWQQQGIGSQLLLHLRCLVTTPRLLVGMWADAHQAIAFYKKCGFSLLPEKDELLKTYWDIPQRQVETSVVMGVNSKGKKE